MNFIKRNYILILILFLGIILRINIDTFASGLNFDEFAIISISKQNFSELFKSLAIQDYHAPLYYIFCHIFANFKSQFLILKLLNVFFSCLNILVFYKIGKTLINKRFGYILALAISTNHLQITTVNFIKFYCLNMLLVSLSVYFLINYIKKEKNKHLLAIANFFITLSFTYGIIFVFFEYLILFFTKNKKEAIKGFIISIAGFILYSPILIIQTQYALTSLISPHCEHPDLSIFGFYILLNDYFSPLINYCTCTKTLESAVLLISALKSFKQAPIDYISIISFVIFSLIPVLISIFGIYKAIKKEVLTQKLALLCAFYILFSAIATLLKINGFIPLYMYPSGIILIILCYFGLYQEKSKIKYLFIAYLIFVQIFITNVYPLQKRELKTKYFANIDKYIEKIDSNTPIIMFDAGRFAKYYYNDKNIIALDYEELCASHGRKLIDEIYGKELNINKKNIKDKFFKIITNNENPKNIEKFINEKIFSKTNKDTKIILIYNSSATPLILSKNYMINKLNKKFDNNLSNSTLFYQLNKDTKTINQSKLGNIIQSYTTQKIIERIEKEYKPIKIEQFLEVPLKNYEKYTEMTDLKVSSIDFMKQPLMGWIFVTYQK